MIIGTGIDLLENKRIGELVDRWGNKFLRKIYTENEINYCNKKKNIQCLAARFAVKEAVVKVLGTGIGAVAWKEIEVINNAKGKPVVFLNNKAKALAWDLKITKLHISISHEKEYTIAMAIAEKEV